MVALLGGLLGLILLAAVASDAFEVMLLPRRVRRQIRPVRLFFKTSWSLWCAVAQRMKRGRVRDTFLSFYGPLSMVLLLAFWASGLIFSFALLHWSLRGHAPRSMLSAIYFSGSTFFTLSYGDVVPNSRLDKALSVIESGAGLGFITVTIGYLPVLYQLFSNREARVIQLDSRAGSPPAASTLLCRHCEADAVPEFQSLLKDWEQWSAELVESHLSYPMLSYYRSQHDNQSWLAALTSILDACAVLLTGISGIRTFQARMTFAMGRLAVVELCRVFHLKPRPLAADRLTIADFSLLQQELLESGLTFSDADSAESRLREIRGTYEPFVCALSRHFLLKLPFWMPNGDLDNWQQSRGGARARDILDAAPVQPE